MRMDSSSTPSSMLASQRYLKISKRYRKDIWDFLKTSQDHWRPVVEFSTMMVNFLTCNMLCRWGWPCCSFWKEHGRKVIESRSPDVASIRSCLLQQPRKLIISWRSDKDATLNVDCCPDDWIEKMDETVLLCQMFFWWKLCRNQKVVTWTSRA